jgi:hypothetical protein
MRRSASLVATLPLVCGGMLAAHDLAYRLAGGAAAHTHTHDYLRSAPLAFGLLIALSVAVLGVALREPHKPLRASAWVFALAPPLAFAVQEHLERALQGESVVRAALEPTFAVGLLLQLPFAFLAYVVARVLLRGASLVAELLARRSVHPMRPAGRASHADVDLLRPAVLGRGFSGRGPPILSS